MPNEREGTTATVHAWSDLMSDHPAPHATRQRVIGERMMISRFEFEAGFEVPPHVHHNEQISIVEQGRLVFRVGAVDSLEFREETVAAGQLIVLPPFVPHGARATEPAVVYDLFSPPSEKTGIDRD